MAIIVNAIIIRGDKIFVVKKKKGVYAGMFGFPGGHVEDDETKEAALVREIKEETNCEIGLIVFKGMVMNNDNECYIFSAKIERQLDFIESDEISEAKWLPISEFVENLKKYNVPNLELILLIIDDCKPLSTEVD